MERSNDSTTFRVSTAIWKQSEPKAFEFATIDQTGAGFVLNGDVVVGDNNNELAITYRIAVDRSWETRDVAISTKSGRAPERRLGLRSNSDRRWSIQRAGGEWTEAPEFDGLIDIDLGCTPATNLLPIRRFDLAIGESAETTAVWVTFPMLDMLRLPQKYTRLDERLYCYESFLNGFTAELHVDDFGVVDRYSDIWTRLNAP
jgi:hypothetical protein